MVYEYTGVLISP